MTESGDSASSWKYHPEAGRDLRIDFIRGMVMFVLVINHVEAFSLYALLTWERFGVVTGGEGFVILSGFVLGMVYRRRIEIKGWADSVNRILDRSFQLYRVNVAVILVVLLFHWLPLINADSVMTYVSFASGKVYNLYPSADAPLKVWLYRILLLQAGPHQFQILGLYIILIFFTPLALWVFQNGRTRELLGGSFLIYIYNWAHPTRITGAQFEWGFTLIAWQLPFFLGMAGGYHRDKIGEFWQNEWVRKLFWTLSIPLFLAFMFFANNNPNPRMPDFAKLSIIPGETFWRIHSEWFLKNHIQPGRLFNYLIVLALGFQLLTHCWKPINKALGWYMIPIGQASLYVFIMHVFLLMIVYNFPFLMESTVGATAACTFILAAEWLMVRYRFLFRWVPR
jgi:hypothetical protein